VAVLCPHGKSKYIHRSKRRGRFELSVLTLVPVRKPSDSDRAAVFTSFSSI